MTVRFSRRSFLKWSGGLALGATSLTLSAASGPRIAATWPVRAPHLYLPNPDALLDRELSAFDLLLVPAYAAAELIQRRQLQPLPGRLRGTPGRAHDPEGAFTWPQHYDRVTLPLAAPWPQHPRLVVGAALWARGYSPNDLHPGRLAQVEQDLRAGRLPARAEAAALLIEYDWVIPQGARPELALEFLHDQRPAVTPPPPAIPLMPFSPRARAQVASLWAA